MKNLIIYTLLATLLMMDGWNVQAQNNNVWKVDTVTDGKGNKTITVYMQKSVVEGNGNVVTRDIDVAAFKEISMILPATVNYKVADNYSCRVTLDENLFEWVDIYLKGDCLRVEMVKTFQQSDVKPTKFLIELTAPTLEEISLVGGGDFSFTTPFEAPRLQINTAGSYCTYFDGAVNVQRLKISSAGSGNTVFNETATIEDLNVDIAGSGMLKCKHLIADHAKLGVAGSGSMVIESGTVKKANLSVAGSGSIEARCQMETMDYSVAGTGSISYPGDVKAVGTVVGGKINKIWGTENCKK